jgi:alkanesulfonate monooxygenase SsuD/methylene tetrahydromethanopterin reductase-like flavin-dependent oxidoreductase (luciferase family)
MVAANVIAADEDVQARQRFTSVQQSFTNMVRGTRGQLPAPIDDIETYWSPAEKVRVDNMLSRSFVGSPATIGPQLERFVEETGIDELMVASAIYDNAARWRSYEILAAMGMRPTRAPAASGPLNDLATVGCRGAGTPG